MTLVAPNQPPPVAAADEVLTYDAQWLCTLRNDQGVAAAAALAKILPRQRAGAWAWKPPALGRPSPEESAAEFVDIEPEIYRLRRRKDPDELARIKHAIAGTEAMHARAKEIIAPGVNELDVFNELQAAAVRAYGECPDRNRQRLRVRRARRAAAGSKDCSGRALHSRPRPRLSRLFCRQHARHRGRRPADRRAAACLAAYRAGVRTGRADRQAGQELQRTVLRSQGTARHRRAPSCSTITWGMASASIRMRRPT